MPWFSLGQPHAEKMLAYWTARRRSVRKIAVGLPEIDEEMYSV
jgi:hypothetical protein